MAKEIISISADMLNLLLNKYISNILNSYKLIPDMGINTTINAHNGDSIDICFTMERDNNTDNAYLPFNAMDEYFEGLNPIDLGISSKDSITITLYGSDDTKRPYRMYSVAQSGPYRLYYKTVEFAPKLVGLFCIRLVGSDKYKISPVLLENLDTIIIMADILIGILDTVYSEELEEDEDEEADPSDVDSFYDILEGLMNYRPGVWRPSGEFDGDSLVGFELSEEDDEEDNRDNWV